MLPKVIMHNSISLDGALNDFEINLGLHYKIASDYKADAHLIGSSTAKKGIEMFAEGTPPERESDFDKPKKEGPLPYWVISDSKGILTGVLHLFRRYDYCKDVIVLISSKTPQDYLDYLIERNYEYIVSEDESVDYTKALETLYDKYNIKTVLTDTGGTLNSILLEKGIINQISLLVLPVLAGKNPPNLFRKLHPKKNIDLELEKAETYEKNIIHLLYNVK